MGLFHRIFAESYHHFECNCLTLTTLIASPKISRQFSKKVQVILRRCTLSNNPTKHVVYYFLRERSELRLFLPLKTRFARFAHFCQDSF